MESELEEMLTSAEGLQLGLERTAGLNIAGVMLETQSADLGTPRWTAELGQCVQQGSWKWKMGWKIQLCCRLHLISSGLLQV